MRVEGRRLRSARWAATFCVATIALVTGCAETQAGSSGADLAGALDIDELRAELAHVPGLDCGETGPPPQERSVPGPTPVEQFSCVRDDSTAYAEVFDEEFRELGAYATVPSDGSMDCDALQGLGYARGTTWVVRVVGPDGSVDEALLEDVADAVSSPMTISECAAEGN